MGYDLAAASRAGGIHAVWTIRQASPRDFFRPAGQTDSPKDFLRSAGKSHDVSPEFNLLASRLISLLTSRHGILVNKAGPNRLSCKAADLFKGSAQSILKDRC